MKKETLKEAAKKYVEQITTIEFGKPHNAPHRVKTFIEGAKWQAERMYSEEEVKRILMKTGNYTKISLDVWFEQFKKK